MANNYKVALFFRPGKTHFLAPGSILVIPNYDSAVGRTVRHRGFTEGAEVTRRLSAEEQKWAAETTRYKLEYYSSWAVLIEDEEIILADDPTIGTRFLDTCKRLSKQPGYQTAKPYGKLSEAQQIEALVAELETNQKPTLDDFERRAVLDTARAIGASQLTLFGEDFLT